MREATPDILPRGATVTGVAKSQTEFDDLLQAEPLKLRIKAGDDLL